MQCQMPGSGAGCQLCEWLFRRTKLSRHTIEPVDHHFVDAEIRGERVSLPAIEDDAMCVWSFLLFLGARSFVLLYVDRHAKRAVSANRQHSHAAARVVRDQQRSCPAINTEMTRVGALSRLLIQQAQVSGRRIDRKRTNTATG